MPGAGGPAQRSGEGRRGRTPTRSREEIAATAVGLADDHGLAAVTMRAVAQALSTGAASLYRYVSTRDDLVALMVEQVNGEFDLHPPTARPWPDQMIELAHQARGIYRRHPWMLQVEADLLPLGSNGYAYLEHTLAILAPGGVDDRTALEAVAVFTAVIRLLCQRDHRRQHTDASDSSRESNVAERMTAVAATGAYPHLEAALGDAGPVHDQFDRVLRRVITGLTSDDGG